MSSDAGSAAAAGPPGAEPGTSGAGIPLRKPWRMCWAEAVCVRTTVLVVRESVALPGRSVDPVDSSCKTYIPGWWGGQGECKHGIGSAW